MSEIEAFGSTAVKNIHCITVIGQIEGHQLLPEEVKTTKYEHILPQLAAVEESSEIEGLIILLNTAGGDVEAGLAIAELIAGMSKPTVSLVLGGGHSIGVPLAVAADLSLIAPTAAMTLHPVRINGTVLGASQSFQYLERMQDRVVDFITGNSRIRREELLSLMHKTGELAQDIGTILTGEEAVRCGIIDRVGTVADALRWLKER